MELIPHGSPAQEVTTADSPAEDNDLQARLRRMTDEEREDMLSVLATIVEQPRVPFGFYDVEEGCSWMEFEDRRHLPRLGELELFCARDSAAWKMMRKRSIGPKEEVPLYQIIRCVSTQYAYIRGTGSYLKKTTDVFDNVCYQSLSPLAVKADLNNVTWSITMKEEGKKRIATTRLGDAWINAMQTEGRLTYEGTMWDPYPPNDRQVGPAQPHRFNTFVPFAYPRQEYLPPLDLDARVKGSVLYKHLAEYIFANDPEELEHHLDWLADILQYPDERRPHVYVIIGPEGVGKTILWERFYQQLIGESNTYTFATMKHVGADFNVASVNKMLTCIEEGSSPSMSQIDEHMKALTGNKTQRAEQKYQDETVTPNFSRYLVVCNHIEEGKTFNIKSSTNRRWILIETANKLPPRGHILALMAYLDNKNHLNEWGTWLMQRRIEHIDWQRPIDTAATRANTSHPPWSYCLQEFMMEHVADWLEFYPLAQLHAHYCDFMRGNRSCMNLDDYATQLIRMGIKMVSQDDTTTLNGRAISRAPVSYAHVGQWADLRALMIRSRRWRSVRHGIPV